MNKPEESLVNAAIFVRPCVVCLVCGMRRWLILHPYAMKGNNNHILPVLHEPPVADVCFRSAKMLFARIGSQHAELALSPP